MQFSSLPYGQPRHRAGALGSSVIGLSALVLAARFLMACGTDCPAGSVKQGSVCHFEGALTADAAVDDTRQPASSGSGTSTVSTVTGGAAGVIPVAGASAMTGMGGAAGSTPAWAVAGASSLMPMAGQSGGMPERGAGSAAPPKVGPCPGGVVPATEICDGQDNDCDGSVDEDLDATPCGSSTQGLCRMGKKSCSAGTWSACQGAIEPTTEVCDANLQNENCNGTSNEGCACTPGQMKPCGAEGLCKAGMQMCSAAGAWSGECSIKPQPEVCDGKADEDCDGAIDNGCACMNGKSEDCANAGLGVCSPGTRTCTSGQWGVCQSKVSKSAETCDGLDNDCNGTPDDGACANGLKCANNKCVECTADTDCKSGHCVGTSCAECVRDDDCGPATTDSCQKRATCGSNGQCVPASRMAVGAMCSYPSDTRAPALCDSSGMCAVPTIALRSEANAGGGSAHGMYVDANNSNNDLRATASSVVSGAKFAIVHNSDGTYSLYSMFRMNYVSAVVDADNNGTNPLRAGSPTIGDWEKYSIETVGGNVRLLAKVNNLYVSAVDSSQTPPYLLRAYTPGTPDRLGDWETFSIHACNAEATAVLGSLPSTNGC